MRIRLLVWLLLLGSAVVAQEPLTENDRLRAENHVLKATLVETLRLLDTCHVDLAPLRTRANAAALTADRQAMKAAIEAAHPGFVYNLETGQLTPSEPSKTEKP